MAQKELIDALKQCGAIQFGHFILTSGVESEYYIDIKKASTQPKILKKIAEHMKEYVQDADVIAGMELGAVPLAVALSLETDLPYVIIRKEKRNHGMGKQIEGGNVDHKRVLIVEDVTTSGGSVEKTVDIIREENGEITKVISVVDRECGADELMSKCNVPFIPLLSVSDILEK